MNRGRLSVERREELIDELPETARHTSERERRANDAERELVQWKKVRFMADKLGEEFDGYITGVAAFGVFVELVEHFVEGMVHVSTMADDYYRFIDRAHMLRGENTGRITGSATTSRAGDQGRHGAAPGRPWLCRDSRAGAGIRAKPRPRGASRAEGPKKETGKKPGKREQRPGKRERQRSKCRS